MGAGVEEEEETEEDRQRKHNYYNSLNIWVTMATLLHLSQYLGNYDNHTTTNSIYL